MQNNPWYANPNATKSQQSSNQFNVKPQQQQGTSNTTQNQGSGFNYNFAPSWSNPNRGYTLKQNRNE